MEGTGRTDRRADTVQRLMRHRLGHNRNY